MRHICYMVRSLMGLGLLGLAAAGLCAGELLAQTSKPGEREVPPHGRSAQSKFRLFGDRDWAISGLRLAGSYGGCADNSGNIISDFWCWWDDSPDVLDPPGWWDIGFYWAVPPSEWEKHKTAVPSLENVRGKGYSVVTFNSEFTGEILPHDATLGPFHAGATSTDDGTCKDFTSDWVDAGNPLLAASDCEETWGSAGWQGSRIVDAEGFAAYADRVGQAYFSFDASKVPEDLQRTDKFMGSFQTFGFFSDYTDDALFGSATRPSYGNVIPEAMGGDPTEEPTRTGWPLGLMAKTDGFSFAAPGMTNTGWFRITFTNNSREVYGVGLDYDSLYMGITPSWYTFQQGTSLYRDPANGVERAATFCQTPTCGPGGDPMHPGDQWGSISGVGPGFNYGASAIIILKSPIGDLRNKKCTQDPLFLGKCDSEMEDDTITFSHGHMCGYHGCTAVTWSAPPSLLPASDYEQRQFGLVASITSDVLGDRAVSEPSDHIMWDTWRWEEYPDRDQLDFNHWTPGNWDYDDDGTDDVLWFDDCTDNAGAQFDPVTGNSKQCSVSWSDTLPGGFGNVYSNMGGNMGVGPFALAADSTVEWVIAVLTANDSLGIETDIAKALDHYMAFYLGPEAAPAPYVTSVEVQAGGGDPGPEGQPEARVTLYFDATTEDWEDPFLTKYLADLRAADPGTELGNIRLLNPFLEDTLEALIPNNVAAIHVFKSCDGGGGFTDDSDCYDDPATGGALGDLGWLPWRTIQPDPAGDFPNVVSDEGVFGGRTFLYSLVPQTRGLELAVATGAVLDTLGTAPDDTIICIYGCGSRTLSIAPSMVPAIATATGAPGVASVYIPVSQQSGAVAAAVELVTPSPDFLPFSRMNVRATTDEMLDGAYNLRFGDQAVVIEIATLTTTGADLDTTIVLVIDGAADTVTLTAPGGAVGVEGAFTESFDTIGARIRRERTTTFDALSAVLSDGDDVPLMVTASLGGGQSVPGRYFGLSNFPGFTMSIDNTLAGFIEQYYLDDAGEQIGPLVEPSVTFLTGEAAAVTAEGRYRVTWSDQAFGSASPFALDFGDPNGTRDAVVASLEGRTVGQTAAVDAATAALVGVDPADLVAVEFPFELENITDAENPSAVTIAVPRDGKQTSLLLGIGLDTLFVDVPETEWIPGDQLVLVEGSALSFGTAVLGCDASVWQRISCNPVALSSAGATGYIPPEADQEVHFSYYQTITSGTEYVFAVESAISGEAAMDSPAAIRAALDSVKVVPNPFVMFSEYSTTGQEDRILFTHVPPRGVLRVFTIAGQFVQELRWEPEDLSGRGDLRFNLRTREGNEMAAGLYLYVLTAIGSNGEELGTAKGKFVLIR